MIETDPCQDLLPLCCTPPQGRPIARPGDSPRAAHALCLVHGCWCDAVAICDALAIVCGPRILQLSANDEVLYLLALIGDVATIFFQFLNHVGQNFLWTIDIR